MRDGLHQREQVIDHPAGVEETNLLGRNIATHRGANTHRVERLAYHMPSDHPHHDPIQTRGHCGLSKGR
jgi:hypothetical protein